MFFVFFVFFVFFFQFIITTVFPSNPLKQEKKQKAIPGNVVERILYCIILHYLDFIHICFSMKQKIPFLLLGLMSWKVMLQVIWIWLFLKMEILFYPTWWPHSFLIPFNVIWKMIYNIFRQILIVYLRTKFSFKYSSLHYSFTKLFI